jgi:glycosyltransferase involved in cell wall biosynthesis
MLDYILMTPARNEQDTLPVAAQSLLNQTHPPRLWLILNDGSTDSTQEIIQALESTHPWISSLSLPPSSGGLDEHFAEVVQYGFIQLQSKARKRGIIYHLIGKMDADVFFDVHCFSSLVREFEKDESLGIASPSLHFGTASHLGHEFDLVEESDIALSDHPSDGVRLYRRQCFEEIGGIEIVRASDSVAEAKAMMRGWGLRRFGHIPAGTSRKAHKSISLWSRWAFTGSLAHYLGYNPLLVLGRFCFETIFGRPRYRSLAYAWGYLGSCLRREDRIKDAEILNYFRFRRHREIAGQVPMLVRKGLARQKKKLYEK